MDAMEKGWNPAVLFLKCRRIPAFFLPLGRFLFKAAWSFSSI